MVPQTLGSSPQKKKKKKKRKEKKRKTAAPILVQNFYYGFQWHFRFTMIFRYYGRLFEAFCLDFCQLFLATLQGLTEVPVAQLVPQVKHHGGGCLTEGEHVVFWHFILSLDSN